LVAVSVFAASVKGPQEFTDKVYIRDGSLYLENTAVSATAAELNALDGITASVAELNYLDYARRVLLSKDSSTQYAFESGTSTGTAVIAFTTPFTANPAIFVSPTVRAAVDVTSNAVVVINGTQSQTNFTTSFAAGTTFFWLAIGQK